MVVHAYSPSYYGGWGRRTAWTQEVEAAVSQDRAIALQPRLKSKTTSKKEKIFEKHIIIYMSTQNNKILRHKSKKMYKIYMRKTTKLWWRIYTVMKNYIERYSMFMDTNTQYCQDNNAIPIKIPASYFVDVNKLILKFI